MTNAHLDYFLPSMYNKVPLQNFRELLATKMTQLTGLIMEHSVCTLMMSPRQKNASRNV